MMFCSSQGIGVMMESFGAGDGVGERERDVPSTMTPLTLPRCYVEAPGDRCVYGGAGGAGMVHYGLPWELERVIKV